MATKKQKRQEMQNKREQFEAEMQQSGLKAQRQDREHRQRKADRVKEEAERENRRLNAILAAAKINNGNKAGKDG